MDFLRNVWGFVSVLLSLGLLILIFMVLLDWGITLFNLLFPDFYMKFPEFEFKNTTDYKTNNPD